MAVAQFLVHILLSIFQTLPIVGDDLDKAMHDCMQERQEMLSWEMTRLLREIEQRGLVLWGVEQRGPMQKIQEQHRFIWNTLVFAALQLWQFWVVAGVLVLLFGLWWSFRKRSCNTEQVKEEEKEEHDDANGQERFSNEYPHWPAQDTARQCKKAEDLVLSFIHHIRQLPSNSFFPVLQPPIGVGSTFEGWSPLEDDPVYSFLVPLKAPQGHIFNMVLCPVRGTPRKFCIDVELECTCMLEQQVEMIQYRLHQSKEDLKRNQALHLLRTLCTASFLDVQKTAHWFSQNVEEVWKALPQSSQCSLTVLPSNRSCNFQVTNVSQKILSIEIIFGVQVGDSDIFLSSQTTEDNTPKTIWPESCAVAERKFFRHMATQAPPNSVHLKCLEVCTRILVGTSFPTYTFKTVVMHLLTTTPLSDWSRKDFVPRLQDIMKYLHCCLQNKRLHHFFFHNGNVPKEINVPRIFKMGEPLNLFQRYLEDPAAHAVALLDFKEMEKRLKTIRHILKEVA